eukprot:3283094-Pleurochrysis_carterae.AAC.8
MAVELLLVAVRVVSKAITTTATTQATTKIRNAMGASSERLVWAAGGDERCCGAYSYGGGMSLERAANRTRGRRQSISRCNTSCSGRKTGMTWLYSACARSCCESGRKRTGGGVAAD